MANGMIKVARELFKNAIIVIDRFHVRNLINEMIWAVKTRLKIKLAREETKRMKEYKINEKTKTKNGKKKWEYRPKRYGNGETKLEMITRCHYQIRKNNKNWTKKEIARWKIIKKIACFKSLITIYEHSIKLYDIYERKVTKEVGTILMKEWITGARRYTRIPESLHLANSIERKLDLITNYFISRHTNGYWEWLNSRIGKIVRDSKGFTNNDYMIFRLITAL